MKDISDKDARLIRPINNVLVRWKDVVFQFKSTRFPEHFWLAKMPSERDGVFEVSAQVKRTPCSDCNLLEDNGTPHHF